MRKKIRFLGSVLAIFTGLAVPGIASAIVVDGIYDPGEGYTNAVELPWFNDHHSIYTEDRALAPGSTQTTTFRWAIDADGSINMFVEVPHYARRMVWAKDCDYDGTGADADCNGIPTEMLDAYLEGARDEHQEIDRHGNLVTRTHKDSVKMDYGTQTGSEYFQLNELGLCFGLQDDGGHCDGANTFLDPDDDASEDAGIFWQTSNHYVQNNQVMEDPDNPGTMIECTEDLCLALDITMSLELSISALGITSLGYADAGSMLAALESLQLHLSDEARDISAVPVPAAFWLFGTALIGFIGISRRTSLG